MSKDNMSFLPEDYVERRIEQRTNIICVSLFVIVLSGIGAAYMVTTAQRAEVKQQSADVDAAFAEAAKRLEQLDELQGRREQMLRKAQVASTLLEPVPRTFLMADLINRMPPTLSLFEVELKSKLLQASVTRRITPKSALAKAGEEEEEDVLATVPRHEVTLAMTGVAPTDVQVAQYMSTLSNSHLVKDVDLVFSERTEVEEVTMRRFRIDMTVDPAADVRRIDPLRLDRKPGRNPLKTPTLTEQQILQQQQDADSPYADGLDGAVDHLKDPTPGR
ncbi:MAG: PilN domain-containing protein [Phycisphaeraceae bacterium]